MGTLDEPNITTSTAMKWPRSAHDRPLAFTPRLPFDLVDNILDGLNPRHRQDCEAMSACALVCYLWVERIRVPRFRVFHLHLATRTPACLRPLRVPRDIQWRSEACLYW